MLKETYVAALKNLSKDAMKVDVGFPSIFSPSENLLSDFNELKWEFMQKGKTEQEARKSAWKKIDFERRYRKEIESKPPVINQLKKIKKLAEEKDVYLYCYCGKKPCHRFILIDLIEKMN
jgi:uncharacterized protein YeaO (DUF488 family)